MIEEPQRHTTMGSEQTDPPVQILLCGGWSGLAWGLNHTDALRFNYSWLTIRAAVFLQERHTLENCSSMQYLNSSIDHICQLTFNTTWKLFAFSVHLVVFFLFFVLQIHVRMTIKMKAWKKPSSWSKAYKKPTSSLVESCQLAWRKVILKWTTNHAHKALRETLV